ncbi:MAG: glucosamine-6-phosphate deaminase [Akkermansiaceae bacterium]|nr:glucosamine-6-phosphate deaminase [Akkermansiaceae bacterium]
MRSLIERRAAEGRTAVLGLATGKTPLPLYRELVRLHREEGLSFSNVIAFNLDEYFGLLPSHPRSYRTFMQEHLFGHIDIRPENAHIPSGSLDPGDIGPHCRAYEALIEACGGIDLQILGIGRTGHIGFNEPGAGRGSRTSLVRLDHMTRTDAAGDFGGADRVPSHAITMGCGTILEARRIILMAWGAAKAGIVAEAFDRPVSDEVPASYLQEHPDASVYLDKAAAADLEGHLCVEEKQHVLKD